MTPLPAEQSQEILHVWFEQTRPRQWFAREPAFDTLLAQRFGCLCGRAISGELHAWQNAPGSALALVLLLDQFPRQIWRETARAYAGDGQALALSQRALARGWLAGEPIQARRQFWLMPLMHSEDPAVQQEGLPLFRRFCDARTADCARRHAEVITRFGRFPHRNAALGRTSSPEELAFLERPGSHF